MCAYRAFRFVAIRFVECSVVLGLGRRGRLGRAGRGPDLGEDVEQVDEGGRGQGQTRSQLALRLGVIVTELA